MRRTPADPTRPVDAAWGLGARLTALGTLTAARVLFLAADVVTISATGRDVRVRTSGSLVSLLRGQVGRLSIRASDVQVGGLNLAAVRVDAARAHVVPGWPPRFRAGPVDVRVTVTQDALDRWAPAAALPVRLRVRSDGLRARTGIGGVRVAEVGLAAAVDEDRIVLSGASAKVLGMGVDLGGLRVVLPLPALPRGTRLTTLETSDDLVNLAFRVPAVDEPLRPDRLPHVAGALHRVRSVDDAPLAASGLAGHGPLSLAPPPAGGPRRRRGSRALRTGTR